HESGRASGVLPRIQIFGTDIDEQALEQAREGRFANLEHVSPERLKRYFVRQGDRYRIIKDIRSMCVFSLHDLTRDPPFSHLDLISCRNLLIYMESDLQKRVISLLHYALQPGGYLFLGSA